MGRPEYYTRRLENQIASIINESILFSIGDERIRNNVVNVTRVEINREKTVASVFICVLDASQKNKMIKMLYKCEPLMQSAIHQKLRIKRYPQLRFLLDKEDDNDEQVRKHIEKVIQQKQEQRKMEELSNPIETSDGEEEESRSKDSQINKRKENESLKDGDGYERTS